MPDLFDPLKALYVSIYDDDGVQLATTAVDGNVSVVSFRYKFDDEDNDVCTIKLQSKEPLAFDRLSIGRGSKLLIKWGYLNNRVSPFVYVAVRDVTSKYGMNIIYTELECTDLLTYMKTARADDVGEGSYIDYIRAQCYGRYNIVIKDRGKKVYAQARRKKREINKEVIAKQESFDDPPIYNPMFEPAPEGTSYIYKEVTDLEIGTWFENDPSNPVREFLEADSRSIITSQRSQYVVMSEFFKTCPSGPWYITGRGDTLYIHNRDLGKTIYRSYKYMAEPGDLIDITAKTKYENFEKQVVSYLGLDPADRKNFYIDDYREALYKQKNLKEILENKQISDEEKKAQIKDYLQLRYESYPLQGSLEVEGALIPFGSDKKLFFIGGKYHKAYMDKLGLPYSEKSDKTKLFTDPWIRGGKEGFNPLLHDPILRAIWITIPLVSMNEIIAVTNNRQRELEMEKEEAKIIVEGDPYLCSERTVFVSNIHKQHVGHYYIKKCEHVITTQGYKTTLECLKVVPESKLVTLGDDYSVTEEGTQELEKQYLQEKYLFGKDVKISYIGQELTLYGGPGYAGGYTSTEKKRYYTLNDLKFVRGYDDDKIAEILVQDSKSPDVDIEEVNVEIF